MKNINPKMFWSVFLFVISIVGVLIFVILGMIATIIFWISVVIGVIVFYPALPYMPVVLNFFLREYVFECDILHVLGMARFDTRRKFGWMTPLEILYAVEKKSGKQPDISDIYVTLGKLNRRGAVKSEYVPVEYLKNPSKRAMDSGIALAYRLDDDSDYKPRKPKWLPKENKKKEDVIDAVTAH